MARPPAHESGKAIEVKLRLSPYHLTLLDSFVSESRSRSGVFVRLLEQADTARTMRAQKTGNLTGRAPGPAQR
jgi:hypothetical protein